MNLPAGNGLNAPNARSLGTVILTLNQDSTFNLFSMLEKTGTWRHEGDKAYLKIERIMGSPVSDRGEVAEKMNKEIVLTRVDDNTITYVDPGELRQLPDGSKPPPVELKRRADKPKS